MTTPLYSYEFFERNPVNSAKFRMRRVRDIQHFIV
jgi:hypothetical protein